MNYTKGKWIKIYVNGVCIGVGAQDKEFADYQEVICNSILPDTDEEYALYQSNIEDNMAVISKAPEMYEAIDLFINGKKSLHDQSNAIEKMKSLLKESKK